MSGFAAVHVSFDGTAPGAVRPGTPWLAEVAPPPGLWIGTAGLTSTASAAGWRLWAAGEVFAYRGAPEAPLARLAADLARGNADAAALRMHAVVLAWEEGPRRLHVLTDRFATVHAYAGGRPGQRSVGTCFASTAAGSARRLDPVALTGFCGFGFYPGDRTPWDDVVVLRPATWTTFDDQGTVSASRRTWDWWYDPTPDRSDDDLVDDFHERWTRAVRSHVGSRTAVVPLSGGLDSRTVYAAFPAATGPDHVRPMTYGYGASSVEVRIGRAVARARGREAAAFDVPRYLFDRIGEVTAAVEGFQALTFSRQAGVADELAALGDVIVGGHWGDVWFDPAGAGAAATPAALAAKAHATFAKRGRAWLLDHVCAPRLGGADPEGVLRDLVHDELARLPDIGDADLQLKALKTEQWSFRWTLASIRAYRLARPTLMPFYDPDVTDFFLRIPPDRLTGRRLQVAYLRRHHPDLARVRWQQTGRPLAPRPWDPPAALIRRAAAKAWRTARRRPVVERNWEVQFLTGDGPARLRAHLLADHPLLPAATPALVEGFLARPDPIGAHAIDALLTLATLDLQGPEGGSRRGSGARLPADGTGRDR